MVPSKVLFGVGSLMALAVVGCGDSSSSSDSPDGGAESSDSSVASSDSSAGSDDAATSLDAGSGTDARADADAGAGKVLYGSTIWGPDPSTPGNQSIAQADTEFGGTKAMPVARFFDTGSPGAIADSHFFSAGRKIVIHSWKADPAAVSSGTYDAAIVTTLRSYPAGVTVLMAYYHEPENNFTTPTEQAAYRAAWDHVIPIIRTTSGVAAKVGSILIVTGFTMSAPNTSGTDLTKWRIANFWPETQVPDYLGVDMDGNADDTYTSPLAVYTPASASSKKWAAVKGTRWGVTEFAHKRISTDTDGSGRVAFLNTMTALFANDGSEFVSYYNSLNNSGGPIAISTKEATLWQTDVQGSE